MSFNEANLGCASTRELMEELRARSEVHANDDMDKDVRSDMVIYLNGCTEEFLEYRTVDRPGTSDLTGGNEK